MTDGSGITLYCWSSDAAIDSTGANDFTWQKRNVADHVSDFHTRSLPRSVVSDMAYFDPDRHAFCKAGKINDPNENVRIYGQNLWGIEWYLADTWTFHQDVPSSAKCLTEQPCRTAGEKYNDPWPEMSWTDESSLPDLERLMTQDYFNTTMRKIADSLTRQGLDESWVSVPGRAITKATQIRVRWHWLILPAFLNILTTVLLITTATSSRKHKTPLWKSSITALLFHGLEDDPRVPRTSKLSHMDELAESMRVKIKPSGVDGRLLFGH